MKQILLSFLVTRMSLGAENKTGMMKQETGCMKRHLQSGYKKVEKEPFLESG